MEGSGNKTDKNGDLIMPEWTYDKDIRICLQFRKNTTKENYWESYRWVLNYTFPNNYTNFTVQMAPPQPILSWGDWCSRPRYWNEGGDR